MGKGGPKAEQSFFENYRKQQDKPARSKGPRKLTLLDKVLERRLPSLQKKKLESVNPTTPPAVVPQDLPSGSACNTTELEAVISDQEAQPRTPMQDDLEEWPDEQQLVHEVTEDIFDEVADVEDAASTVMSTEAPDEADEWGDDEWDDDDLSAAFVVLKDPYLRSDEHLLVDQRIEERYNEAKRQVDEIEQGIKAQRPAAAQKSQKELELEGLVANGLPARGKWGLKFLRSDDSKGEKYTSLKLIEKQEFRKEWAMQKLHELRMRKEKCTRYQQVDSTKGRYLPFRKVVEEEGLDNEGLAAASLYWKRATAMGGRWVMWNDMTDRVEVLYLHRDYQEEISTSWSLFSEYSQQKSAEPVVQGSVGVQNVVPVQAAGSKGIGSNSAASLTRQRSQSTVGGDDADPPPSMKKKYPRTSCASQLKKAQAQKKAMETQQLASQNILDAVQTDNNWMTFKDSQDVADLTAKMNDVKSHVGDFGRAFATEKLQDLKSMYDEKSLNAQLKAYTDRLASPVADLEQVVGLLLRLKAARSGRA